MKPRFPFSLKIFLPYLLIASLFAVIFFRVEGKDDTTLILLSGAGVLMSLGVGMIHYFWLRKPLYRVRDIVASLNLGKLPDLVPSKATDEIADVERRLGSLVEALRSLSQFAGSLASGKFSAKYEKLSDEDELGESLISLKGSLMASRKEGESRRRDEENRTWAAQGLAKFSKLFREAEDDLHELSRELMRELVAYTEADVGALFILSDDDPDPGELQLTGSYAFDREKFLKLSYQPGEGLVGRAAMEKDLLYITDLPPGYMKIRSGLGEDTPSSLLLVPVLLDSEVLGVIELASLGEIPAFQAGFLQQLAEALGTTIAKVKANQKNKLLLDRLKKQS